MLINKNVHFEYFSERWSVSWRKGTDNIIIVQLFSPLFCRPFLFLKMVMIEARAIPKMRYPFAC